MKTRDIDIRKKLHIELDNKYSQDKDTIILDELGLCQGEARVDVVVINGAINGYEIKSESDTLERLPRQVDFYNKVMDTVTIVSGECFKDKVTGIIPEWWGIKQVKKNHEENSISFVTVRESKTNTDIDPYSIVQLLWRDEALELLKHLRLEKGYLSKPRKKIWEKLVNSLSLDELKYYVRQQLKNREHWRSD